MLSVVQLYVKLYLSVCLSDEELCSRAYIKEAFLKTFFSI
jgi:hypothetical protein